MGATKRHLRSPFFIPTTWRMLVRITNNGNISLSLAVWLIDDNYDYLSGKDFAEYISVTTLMRPTKQIVLGRRVPMAERVEDVEDYISRALGNAIHAGVELAWKKNFRRNLKLLGHPESVVDLVRINPDDAERKAMPDMIPVFMEQRGYREVNGVTIGGKFDLVADGHVEDNKSTSAYGWVFGTRDDENRLQGSLYRWIDAAQEMPKITESFMRVNYIFTDWQKAQARQNEKYPQSRVAHKDIALLSLEDTELFVKAKLFDIKKNHNLPESQMAICSDEDLWRSDAKYKFYSDPAKANVPGAKSTKNFDSLSDANRHRAEVGKGIVKIVPGEVKRCPYCPAYDVCEQRKQYFAD